MPHSPRHAKSGLASSLKDLDNATGTHGPATLADGELEAVLHGDGLDQLDAHAGVVARHDHLGALGQRDDAGDVRGAEVELRTVVLEERGVPAALLLGEDVDLRLELRVRGVRARLHDDHAALDLFALDTAEQQADVLTGAGVLERLAEHLDRGDLGLDRLLLDADDLDVLVRQQDAALAPAGDDRATAGDRKDVLDRHQERLVDLALWLRDVRVDRVHELHQGVRPLRVALEGPERRDA